MTVTYPDFGPLNGDNSGITFPKAPTSTDKTTPTNTPSDGGFPTWGTGTASGAGAGETQDPRNIAKLPIIWNPPPHKLTRPPKISWNNYDPKVKDSATNVRVPKYGYVPRFGRLGAIYTDDFTASAATSLFTRYRYGCQFHYNPTSLSYSASTDLSNISAISQGTDPVGLAIPGTVNLNFELYFNRIYDMAYMGSDSYERPLRKAGKGLEDEATMIRQLGTEYDIEYLYRAANGDPKQVRHVGRKTADYGYMMRNLLRLRIGSFQYIGMINSISVNHILFTEDMIPTFSSVSISFDRQVTIGGNDSSFKDSVDAIQNATGSTGSAQ